MAYKLSATLFEIHLCHNIFYIELKICKIRGKFIDDTKSVKKSVILMVFPLYLYWTVLLFRGDKRDKKCRTEACVI
jgi:hypothetical protein